jgi:hypothetical protein
MSNSNGYRKRSELLSEISNIYKIPASTAESKLDKILGKYVINHTESPIGMSSVPWNHSKYFFIKGFNTQYPHLYKENDIWKYMLEHNSNIPVKRGRPKKHVPQVKVFTPKEVQQKTQVTNPISNQPVVSEIGCHKGRDKGSFEKIFAKMGELLDRGIKRLADSL